jgi:hypothetical protein
MISHVQQFRRIAARILRFPRAQESAKKLGEG